MFEDYGIDPVAKANRMLKEIQMLAFILKHTVRMKKIAKIARWLVYTVIILGYFADLNYWFWHLLALTLVVSITEGALSAYKVKAIKISSRLGI